MCRRSVPPLLPYLARTDDMEPNGGIEPPTYALPRCCSERTRFRIRNPVAALLGQSISGFCSGFAVG
jgi:hypothetical protein